MTKQPDTIRAKNYFLSQRQLLAVLNSQRFRDDRLTYVEIAEPLGLPEDAKVMPNGVMYSPRMQGFEILVGSESFPETILDGNEIPIHDGMFLGFRTYKIIGDRMEPVPSLKDYKKEDLEELRKSIDEELYDRERRGK